MAIHLDMAVAHQLAALGARSSEAHAIDHVVQPALQHVQHVVAGDALHGAGLLKQIAELAFEQLIIAARLLLFPELQAIAHNLRFTILAMLARNEVALFDGALLGVAALAFEEQLHPLAPALPAHGTNISCQIEPP